MNKKWYIEMFNIFTKKRHKGIVTGELQKIKAGLASSGWDVIMAMPAEYLAKR